MTDAFSLFDIGLSAFKIDKPIRLIELFAGCGSQALALKYLGVPFEHWLISEWAVPSIKAYALMHDGEKEEDFAKIKDRFTYRQLMHFAGDSIVTTCLMALFGELCEVDYREKIADTAEAVQERKEEML